MPPTEGALGILALGALLAVATLHVSRLSAARARELTATQERLDETAAALSEARREIDRLTRIPKAEMLPMLQLTHELRSPLAAIQGTLDTVLQGYTANNPELEGRILTSARDRAADMLARVNDMLRLGALRYAEVAREVQSVQILDVARQLVPEMTGKARWRSVELAFHLPDALPPVAGTTEDMEHLLSNLINNAIKYTEPGGSVTVGLRERGSEVVGYVEDTGIGIAQEDMPRVFDEFYRSAAAKEMDEHGTGLGLSIVKRIVDLYGGRIHLESAVGEGSTFAFSFPALDEDQVALGGSGVGAATVAAHHEAGAH